MRLLLVLIGFMLTMNSFAMQLKFKTLREEGILFFTKNELKVLTHQKDYRVPVLGCNQKLVDELRTSITKNLKKEKIKKSPLIILNGRRKFLSVDSRGYKLLDDIHESLETLKVDSRYHCLKQGVSWK